MTASTISAPRFPGAAAVTTVVWLGLVLLAGATGFLERLPFPGPQVIILALVVATLFAVMALPALRAWADAVPLNTLIGINGLRVIGIVFLVLGARGTLNPLFAERAGWGDAATAGLALVLVAVNAPRTPAGRAVTQLWNALGFFDLVVAVGTATAVTLQRATPGVAPVLSLPLILIPTFFVPIFLANHVVIFRRLLARQGR